VRLGPRSAPGRGPRCQSWTSPRAAECARRRRRTHVLVSSGELARDAQRRPAASEPENTAAGPAMRSPSPMESARNDRSVLRERMNEPGSRSACVSQVLNRRQATVTSVTARMFARRRRGVASAKPASFSARDPGRHRHGKPPAASARPSPGAFRRRGRQGVLAAGKPRPFSSLRRSWDLWATPLPRIGPRRGRGHHDRIRGSHALVHARRLGRLHHRPPVSASASRRCGK